MATPTPLSVQVPELPLPQEKSRWVGNGTTNLTASTSLLAGDGADITQLESEGMRLFLNNESRLAAIIFFVTMDVTFESYSKFVANVSPAGRAIGPDPKKIANQAHYFRARVLGNPIVNSYVSIACLPGLYILN